MTTLIDPGAVSDGGMVPCLEKSESTESPSTNTGNSWSSATNIDASINSTMEPRHCSPHQLESGELTDDTINQSKQDATGAGGHSEIPERNVSEDGPQDEDPPDKHSLLPDNTEPTKDTDPMLREAEKSFLELYKQLHRKVHVHTGQMGYNPRSAQSAHEYILAREAGMSLEKRTANAKRLSFVFQSFFRLIDDRLDALEQNSHDRRNRNRRHRLSLDATDCDSDSDSESDGKRTEHVKVNAPKAILLRMPWSSYKRNYDSEHDVKEEHAIDILTDDPLIPHGIWGNRLLRDRPVHLRDKDRFWNFDLFGDVIPGTTQKDSSHGVPPTQHPESPYSPLPEMIRLNGTALIQLLNKALELGIERPDKPMVLLKPFKLLIHHANPIRTLHRQLKMKFASSVRAVPGQGSEFGESHESSSGLTWAHRQERADNGGPDILPSTEGGNDLLQTYGTEQAYKELTCLIEFMDNDLNILSSFADASMPCIYFSDLWHIFRPGEEVITSTTPVNAYRVMHVTGGRRYLSPPEEDREDEDEDDSAVDFTKSYRIPEKSSDFVVTCYQMDFDGSKYGPVTREFRIHQYEEQQDVTRLAVYPLKFAKDQAHLRGRLLSNGETFLRLSKSAHVQYRGPNLHEIENLDSQVIIDFNAALTDRQDKDETWEYAVDFGIKPPSRAKSAEVIMVSAGGCREPGCCENDYVFDDINLDYRRMEDFLQKKTVLTTDVRYLSDNAEEIDKEDLILFPHRLFAFILKDRKWAVIDVNNVVLIDKSSQQAHSGWESLILPKGHKPMVYSLVQAHFRARKHGEVEEETQVDLIRGKGKGLIILLHGAPGVGKTSTAECVAELCDRPLYPITCGDLGITAQEVEGRLKRIFVQAQKWKCVLLLDEADVFLSQRENNVKHNSLVSVFLRVLEYYQGILFLTTNRVGKMDEAFRSRVHISLYYPPLSEESTIDIFRENVERIEHGKVNPIRIKKAEIEQFAHEHYKFNDSRTRWNGRQIRNAFHIAVALAENEAIEKNRASTGEARKEYQPTLRSRHLLLVEETSTHFDEYMISVLGMAQSDLAKQKSVRLDTWNSKAERGMGIRGHDNGRPTNTRLRRPPMRVGMKGSSSEDSDENYTDDQSPRERIVQADHSSYPERGEHRRRVYHDSESDGFAVEQDKRKGKQRMSEGHRDKRDTYGDGEREYITRPSRRRAFQDSSKTRR